MKVKLSEIYEDGHGAPNSAFLSMNLKGLAEYVFRAGDVYELRMNGTGIICTAYRVMEKNEKYAELELIDKQGSLKRLTSLILKANKRFLVIGRDKRKMTSRVDNEEMGPSQKVAYNKYIEGE